MYKCILCSDLELKFYMFPRDNKEKKIYKCLSCSMIQIHPRMYVFEETLPNGKLEYQDKLRIISNIDKNKNSKEYNISVSNDFINIVHLLDNDCDRYISHLEKFIENNEFLNTNISILDVGTGYGYFPHKINKKFNNINVYGLDLNKNKLLYGKFQLNLNINLFFDKIEDESFIKENENKFDIITSWHVLEHVYDPVLWLGNIMRLLKSNGRLLLEIPNEDDELIQLVPNYSQLIHFQDHVNYFNKNTLINLLKKCSINNYEISGVQRYGFYNYIDWIRYSEKEKIESDDYININNKPRSKIEEMWIKYRETNLNCDTLYCIIQKE